ncbi:MAG: hypothetical protein ABI681_06205 [Gemmatimonadales bacterium]
MNRIKSLTALAALLAASTACTDITAAPPATAGNRQAIRADLHPLANSLTTCGNPPAPDGSVLSLGLPNTTAQSLNSSTPTLVRLTNATCSTVSVYWLDFTGQRVFYNSLAPGDSYVQGTYLTHPWVIVRESDGLALVSYMPIPTYGVAYIFTPGRGKVNPFPRICQRIGLEECPVAGGVRG